MTMEYSQEEKIKIQIDNNNCIISGFNTYKTNSNISTNNNTKTSSIKKFQKNLQNNLDNEISLSISKSQDNDNYNNNDLSMIEITEKSIFNSEFNNNGSFNNKSQETKKKNKEKKLKKVKEGIIRKLNFDLPNNNYINNSKNKKNQEKKYPLLNKIISDSQKKKPPVEKKLKNNVVTKKITKKIKINLNFKEINLHKNNSFKKNNNDLKEQCNTMNTMNTMHNITNKNNNIIVLKKNKNISFNININLNPKENKKINTANNSLKKQKKVKKLKKQLSLTLNNKEKNINIIDNTNNHIRYNKKNKNLILNYLNRNSMHKFSQISGQRYNTCLTTISNSSILKNKKENNDNNILKQNKLLYIKDKIKKSNLKSSNISSNHSRRNTMSDYESDINKNNKLNNHKIYSNFGNSLKSSTSRGKVNNNYNKIKMLKKMLKIFGKELYNPIQSKPNEKIKKRINDLDIISDNKTKLSKSLFKKID